MQMTSELIIPVYLNQRIVFDMLAMLEGGISHVTRVAYSEKNQEADKRRYGAEFGLSKALSSLLSINVSGNRKKATKSNSSVEKDEERVHTPASLFYRLRKQLADDSTIKVVSSDYCPQIHDLVEFSASMKKNPLIQTMESFISLMEMAFVLTDEGTGNRNTQKQKKRENDRTLQQMRVFLDEIKSGDTIDIIAEAIPGAYKAVVTLESEYLNDPTMADLVDGKFSVVGKVIRTIEAEKGTISLIRKSALAMMPKSILDGMMVGLQQLSDEDFNLPDLQLELAGPAFQILPIAIFA
jgi:hypothetical protein